MGGNQSQQEAPLRQVVSRSDDPLESRNKDDKIKGLTRLITAQSRKRKDVQRDQYDFTKVLNLSIIRILSRQYQQLGEAISTSKGIHELPRRQTTLNQEDISIERLIRY